MGSVRICRDKYWILVGRPIDGGPFQFLAGSKISTRLYRKAQSDKLTKNYKEMEVCECDGINRSVNDVLEDLNKVVGDGIS